MSKKQRLLNAVKTLNLTLEQRQELVEAIGDLGVKTLNMSVGVVEPNTNKMFLEINNVKIIQDIQGDGGIVFSFTKDELFKMFNVTNIFDISIYNGINLKMDSFLIDHIEISNRYIGTNVMILNNTHLPNKGYLDNIKFMCGDIAYIDIEIIGNDVEFKFTA